MLQTLSPEVNLKALLTFTRVLIKNSKNVDIIMLKEVLNERKKELGWKEKISKEEEEKLIKEFEEAVIEMEKQRLGTISKKIEVERSKLKEEEENLQKKKEELIKQEIKIISKAREEKEDLSNTGDELPPVKETPKETINPKPKEPIFVKETTLEKAPPLTFPPRRRIPPLEEPRPKRAYTLPLNSKTQQPPIPARTLRLPVPKLPERLRHLQPVASGADIDLGKINGLIRDRNINSIECLGENIKVIVEGKMGKMPTGIILNKQEIEQIIDAFSVRTKIPVGLGVFKVAYGQLMITATIPESAAPTFKIEKIRLSNNF